MISRREFVRALNAGEEDKVDALLRLAFGGEDEARLVRSLRKNREIVGEQVIPMGDAIVGYYALSRMVAPKGWLALAPVAVDPAHQCQGLGRRLIGQLGEWARLTKTPVVVLGEPAFYGRCGFSAPMASALASTYPSEHLLLAGFDGAPPKMTLTYPKAFDGV